MPPGTLVYTGEQQVESVRITVIDYDEQHVQEKQVASPEECLPFRQTPTVTWINVDGLHDVSVIEKLGKAFDLHPLLLEDILSTGQRPKFEDYEKNLFIVVKMLSFSEDSQAVETEQVSLIIGPNFVLSFQETVGDVFDYVRDRIRNAKGRIRKLGADFLAYSLVDAIVDGYFVILEKLGEKIENLEGELVREADQKTLQKIHSLKREMITLRRSIWPLRELIGSLQRSESALVAESTSLYLRDLYDHTVLIIDTIESFREMVSGMLDIYLSSLSNRTNAVMKVLTIIATLFIPLTFIAGVYGMNFEHMPELRWRYGYAAIWAVMIVVASIMLVYFRRRRWL
ncbi:MAG: magnesium/cobalt transporter CorA [Sedimentisphaerales bacterium]|nr:magnesium/cobalt transporter CorA [Sedimentisphaerales bacterium]HNY76891.1 magnesium/cobalt transporter CorA [Sedimentisphaerales bacterium]HOC62745.1 magnesium/cobalt transporter CorA [Sedimentisphaerales bacterium]HOH62665.1 magnesium/cobalt transporter CorA [Sedimentisphaerales bacterium]HPY49530.1 magnesium/cobalt transporter CorA [Sedimentisphaerales bacterium]